MTLTTHLHLVPRSRMRGAMPPLPNTPSWHGTHLKESTGTTLSFIHVCEMPRPSHPTNEWKRTVYMYSTRVQGTVAVWEDFMRSTHCLQSDSCACGQFAWCTCEVQVMLCYVTLDRHGPKLHSPDTIFRMPSFVEIPFSSQVSHFRLSVWFSIQNLINISSPLIHATCTAHPSLFVLIT
jgi:hypothetical protein